MKKTRRMLALFAAVSLMAGSISGCGSKGNSAETAAVKEAVKETAKDAAKETTPNEASAEAGSGAAEENAGEWYGNGDGTPVTLKVWGGIQPEYGYDQAIANFNEEFKDKGIQAEYVRYVNNADGNLQVDTYLMSEGEIDVLVGYGAEYLLNRAESDQLLNLTEMLNEAGFDSVKEMGAASMSQYWVDGDQIYGIPTIYSNNRWMMVNVDLFEQAGLEVPYDGWTYDEFLAAAEKLTTGEGLDKTYGVMWCFNSAMVQSLGLIGSTLGQQAYYKNLEGTETNFDNEAWVKGMSMVKSTVDNGWAYGLDDEVSESLTFANTFLEGKAAISMNISQLRLILDTETYPHDFKTAMVPGPVLDESYMTDEYKYHNNYSGTNDLISIAKGTEHPEACFQFLLWYVTGGMAPLAEYGRIPLWSGFDASVITNLLAGKGDTMDLKSLENYLNIDKSAALTSPKLNAYTQIDAVLQEEYQNILLGQSSVEEAMTSAKTRADQLLK